jgi:hypothetical protein
VKENLEVFFREVPVLQLFGSARVIDREVPYDIDEDVQLVCKYLKAYDQKKIDRLYTERFPDNLVQFSKDNDLPDEECHQLLRKHMKEHVASTKITQQLFVR